MISDKILVDIVNINFLLSKFNKINIAKIIQVLSSIPNGHHKWIKYKNEIAIKNIIPLVLLFKNVVIVKRIRIINNIIKLFISVNL